MTMEPRTSIIVEVPSEMARNPALWRIFNAATGRQIITITELCLRVSAEGLAEAEAIFMGGTKEYFDIAGFRVRL